jgi:2'-5' RNA ligase
MKKNVFLYLVVLLEGKFLKEAFMLQRILNKKFRIYDNILPPLHITLAAFQPICKNQNYINDLNKLITHYNKFFISGEGFSSFPQPYKSINISIKPSDKINFLKTEAHKTLWSNNCILGKTLLASWDYHVSLVSTTFGRNWSIEEWNKGMEFINKYEFKNKFLAKTIQLWYPEYRPTLKVIHSFSLKDSR